MDIEILKKRAEELEALFNSHRDQLNHLIGRWTEAKELYAAAKDADASQIIDGVFAGLEKVKAEEDAAKEAPAEGKVNAAG